MRKKKAMLPANLQHFFSKTYDGCLAAVFEDTKSHEELAQKLDKTGISFKTKIIKGKRAGVWRRSFVIMAIPQAESPHGT